MKSISKLMKRKKLLLRGFEREVYQSQKKAMQYKEHLDKLVERTSFGVSLRSKDYPHLTPGQQYLEQLSYIEGLKALSKALLYLTDHGNTQLQFWQFQDLVSYVHNNYPQTMYGYDNISEGNYFFYRIFKKVTKESKIPLSDEVKKVCFACWAQELRGEFCSAYQQYLNMDPEQAKYLSQIIKIDYVEISDEETPEASNFWKLSTDNETLENKTKTNDDNQNT